MRERGRAMEEVLREKIEGRKEGMADVFPSPPFVLPSWKFLFRLKDKQKSLSLVIANDDRDFPQRNEEAAKKFFSMLDSVYF